MLISQTPLRISLAGGGTDLAAYYSEKPGAVLSTAIDKFVYVIVNPRFDDRIVLGYTRKEIVDDVAEIEHELIRAAMEKTGVGRGVEVVTIADIPSEGSGLGSSSSVTVGLLHALHAYRGTEAGPERLAREACEIEIDICGKPIGKQDQYIAAYGGMRHIDFLPDESVRVEDVELDRDARRGFGERIRTPCAKRRTSCASSATIRTASGPLSTGSDRSSPRRAAPLRTGITICSGSFWTRTGASNGSLPAGSRIRRLTRWSSGRDPEAQRDASFAAPVAAVFCSRAVPGEARNA